MPLVTAITFTDIIVFVLVLCLCISNSHTIFLLIPHFRFLNITIEFYIFFPSYSSSKFPNKCLTIPPLPSLPPLSKLPNTICCQHTISCHHTQSPKRNFLLLFLLFQIFSPALIAKPITILTTELSTVPLTFKYHNKFKSISFKLFTIPFHISVHIIMWYSEIQL